MGTAFSFDKFGALATPIRRKRKREEDDINNSSVNNDLDLETPKRKRTKSTSKYIYQTLFLEGQGSDVTIVALGKEWHLHKVYLCQCAYFSSMFCGSWTESSLKTITVSIPDENIDEDALKITFGSLYTDTVFIKPVNVTRVLAAANLFQLEGLIQQCALMMKENISGVTVCGYYSSAHTYGLETVKKQCVSWLEKNLLRSQSAELLQEISRDLMTVLVASEWLLVIQVEMNIYTMLKRWMFLQLNSDWKGDLSALDNACFEFYSNITEGTVEFLEKSAGRRFIRVFSAIRWQHVVCDITSLHMIQQDRIVPLEWLRPVIQYQWLHMLQVDQGHDTGPTEEMVSETAFRELCVRCGRVLEKEGQFFWRWTGYNFGLDLILSYSHGVIGMKRNTMSEGCPNAVSLQDYRKVFYRLTVLSLDEMGRTKNMQSTGIQHTLLAKDEEKVIMVCSKDLKFPLHINLNLMFATPMQDLPKPVLCPPEPWHCDVEKQDVALQVEASDLLSEIESETEGVSLCRYRYIQPTSMSPVKLSRETQTHRTKTVHWSSSDPVISGKVLNTSINKFTDRSPVNTHCSRSESTTADVISDSDEESRTELTRSGQDWSSTFESQTSGTDSSTIASTSHCPPSTSHCLARSSLSLSRSHNQASPSH
ncbi:germ cell-less protein-like 1 [Liolophura sinensis]|uniref:germ cell-less protein-like 1 n=1 Tax=Liolophura sinensis TaxID=3198878 RepID=UPI003158C0B4